MENAEQGVLVGDVQEPEETIVIPKRNATETEVKHAAMQILAGAGMGNNAIAKAVNYHPASAARALTKMKKESLAHPHKLKLASKVMEKAMSGFVGEAVKGEDGKLLRDEKGKPVILTDPRVKASDAIRAAELSYKAAGELDRDQGSGGNVQTFIQVNQQFFGGNNET